MNKQHSTSLQTNITYYTSNVFNDQKHKDFIIQELKKYRNANIRIPDWTYLKYKCMQIDHKYSLLSYSDNMEFMIQICKELEFSIPAYIRPIVNNNMLCNRIQIGYLEYIDGNNNHDMNNNTSTNKCYINNAIKTNNNKNNASRYINIYNNLCRKYHMKFDDSLLDYCNVKDMISQNSKSLNIDNVIPSYVKYNKDLTLHNIEYDMYCEETQYIKLIFQQFHNKGNIDWNKMYIIIKNYNKRSTIFNVSNCDLMLEQAKKYNFDIKSYLWNSQYYIKGYLAMPDENDKYNNFSDRYNYAYAEFDRLIKKHGFSV